MSHEEITRLDVYTDELAEKIDDVNDRLATRMRRVDTAIDGLVDSFDRLKEAIIELQGRMDKYDVYFDISRKRHDAITLRVNEFSRKLEGLKTKSEGNSSSLHDVKSVVSNLSKRVQDVSVEREASGPLTSPTESKDLSESVKSLEIRSKQRQLLAREDARDEIAKLESRYKQEIAEVKWAFKHQLDRLQTRLNTETQNSMARAQNARVNGKSDPILPLRSAETGNVIPNFPRTSMELEKLNATAIRSILKHLEQTDNEEATREDREATKATLDPFGKIWTGVSGGKTVTATGRQELDALKTKMRAQVGLPVEGLRLESEQSLI